MLTSQHNKQPNVFEASNKLFEPQFYHRENGSKNNKSYAYKTASLMLNYSKNIRYSAHYLYF